MFKFDLLNIFEGLVRNYPKLDLNKNSNRCEINAKEAKYIQWAGDILGYSSIINDVSNREDKKTNSEVIWRSYNDKNSMAQDLVFKCSKEDDITKDIFTIQSLIQQVNESVKDVSFMQILEVSSKARIEYLNSQIKSYINNKGIDVLVIYNIPQIKEEKSYIYAHLFRGNELIRERNAISYIDIFENIKVKFIEIKNI